MSSSNPIRVIGSKMPVKLMDCKEMIKHIKEKGLQDSNTTNGRFLFPLQSVSSGAIRISLGSSDPGVSNKPKLLYGFSLTFADKKAGTDNGIRNVAFALHSIQFCDVFELHEAIYQYLFDASLSIFGKKYRSTKEIIELQGNKSLELVQDSTGNKFYVLQAVCKPNVSAVGFNECKIMVDGPKDENTEKVNVENTTQGQYKDSRCMSVLGWSVKIGKTLDGKDVFYIRFTVHKLLVFPVVDADVQGVSLDEPNEYVEYEEGAFQPVVQVSHFNANQLKRKAAEEITQPGGDKNEVAADVVGGGGEGKKDEKYIDFVYVNKNKRQKR